MRRSLIAISLAVTVIICADCRRGKDAAGPANKNSSATPESAEPASTELPPCAHVEKTISLPPEFPKIIPLPPATVFTATRRTERALLVEGLVPLERRNATLFFLQKFPAAGFKLGRGESEPEEAEAPFQGHGVVGIFKLRNIRDCPGAVQLIISVQTLPEKR